MYNLIFLIFLLFLKQIKLNMQYVNKWRHLFIIMSEILFRDFKINIIHKAKYSYLSKKNLLEKEVNYKYYLLVKIINCYHNYDLITAYIYIYIFAYKLLLEIY